MMACKTRQSETERDGEGEGEAGTCVVGGFPASGLPLRRTSTRYLDLLKLARQPLEPLILASNPYRT